MGEYTQIGHRPPIQAALISKHRVYSEGAKASLRGAALLRFSQSAQSQHKTPDSRLIGRTDSDYRCVTALHDWRIPTTRLLFQVIQALPLRPRFGHSLRTAGAL